MLAVKHAGNHGKVASVYLHSPGGRTCTSNVVKTNLHQLQTYIFHQFRFPLQSFVVTNVTTVDAK